MKNTVFGENMRKARALKGWSQEGAAQTMGIKRSLLAAYEVGNIKKTLYDKIKKIQSAYDISDWDAFVSQPDYFEQKITGEELEKRYKDLDGPAKQAVNALLGID